LNKIQVGQYDLGVVNYAGADGRQVLVSIHDQIFGHLGAYHYTMGEEQRDDVKYQLSIQVTQKSNPQRSFFTPSMADYDIKIVSKP
jgi:outer membrane phospholipase A